MRSKHQKILKMHRNEDNETQKSNDGSNQGKQLTIIVKQCVTYWIRGKSHTPLTDLRTNPLTNCNNWQKPLKQLKKAVSHM